MKHQVAVQAQKSKTLEYRLEETISEKHRQMAEMEKDYEDGAVFNRI